jgi:SSS family solute:Na+ symporter
VLVLAVALVSSSVDTLQTALASLVTSQRRDPSLTRARWTTVLLMVPAVVVALQGFGVLRLFLIADLLCAGIAVPALLALWARATPAGALAGSVAGLVGGLLGGAVPSGSLADGLLAATFPSGAPTLAPFLGALVVSAVVTVAVSLLGRRTEDLEAIGARVAPLS